MEGYLYNVKQSFDNHPSPYILCLTNFFDQ